MAIKNIYYQFEWCFGEMDSIADFEKWIGEMRSELAQQVTTVRQLAFAFSENYIQLTRHDQVNRLETLKSRIDREVEDVERMESAAQTGYVKGTMLNSGFAFAFGSFLMHSMGHKRPLRIGAQMAGVALSRKVPFNNVLIGIEKQGIPKDVTVIPVSRLSRESNRSESEVKRSLKYDGYLLMTPGVFTQALEKVKSEILDGSLSLPIKISEITKRITR